MVLRCAHIHIVCIWWEIAVAAGNRDADSWRYTINWEKMHSGWINGDYDVAPVLRFEVTKVKRKRPEWDTGGSAKANPIALLHGCNDGSLISSKVAPCTCT